MKYLIITFIAATICQPIYAQNSTSKTSAPPALSVQEKLIELAIQNPDLEIADRKVTIAKYQLKEAKGWWLNNISLSFNANDFTVKRLSGKTQANGQSYPIYPLYNFGLNIPIGGIFSKPAATKAAREQVAIQQAMRNGAYRQIKTSVLSAYQNYLTSKELLTVQSQLTENTYSDYLQAKQKFRNGQISIEDYNSASQLYSTQLISRINAENALKLRVIELESLIGVPLNTVLTSPVITQSNSPTDSSSESQ